MGLFWARQESTLLSVTNASNNSSEGGRGNNPPAPKGQ